MFMFSKSQSVSARLPAGIVAAAFAVGLGASGQALAASPTEVALATAAQALTYCQAGSLPKGGVAYFGGTAGAAQFAKKCAQAVPNKSVKDALLVTGSTVSECKLATAKQAAALCNAGDMGEWDIAYIAGPAGTVIGGPGYGCGTSITTGGIGNAICK
jgi:hypothetical protein